MLWESDRRGYNVPSVANLRYLDFIFTSRFAEAIARSVDSDVAQGLNLEHLLQNFELSTIQYT